MIHMYVIYGISQIRSYFIIYILCLHWKSLRLNFKIMFRQLEMLSFYYYEVNFISIETVSMFNHWYTEN